MTAGIDYGDLSHLAPEDADLYRALYRERNTVSRGELARVRAARERANRRVCTGESTSCGEPPRCAGERPGWEAQPSPGVPH